MDSETAPNAQPPSAEPVRMRSATPDDARAVFDWRNHPATRAASRDTGELSLPGHLAWFAAALADTDRLLLIGERGRERVGMVRYDRRAAELWEVSINVAAEQRGRGAGSAMLEAAQRLIGARHPGVRVLATVRSDNAVSLALFRRCGFTPTGEDGGFVRLTATSV